MDVSIVVVVAAVVAVSTAVMFNKKQLHTLTAQDSLVGENVSQDRLPLRRHTILGATFRRQVRFIIVHPER